MTTEQQAIYLNALPLLGLGVAYLAAAAVLAPSLVRSRGRLRELEPALALVFPCGGAAAVVLGVLVLRDREPVGGQPWLALLAIVVALGPAVAFFARVRDRGQLLTGATRGREIEERERLHAAASLVDAARALCDRASASVGVEFAALVLVSEDGTEGIGVAGRARGEEVPWMADVRLDLLHEPSGVTSAYHDASPFAVFDAASSGRVSQRLVRRSGVQSVAYVPLLLEERVVAVLVVGSLGRHHAFSTSELAALQSAAAEAAPVVDRLRPRTGGDERDAALARITARARTASGLEELLDATVADVAPLLRADRCFVRVGDSEGSLATAAEWTREGLEPSRDEPGGLAVSNLSARRMRTVEVADVATAGVLDDASLGRRELLLELGSRAVIAVPIVAQGRLRAVFAVHRREPGEWRRGDVAYAEAVARELGSALERAAFAAERGRRLERQSALLQAAQTLTSELELERVLDRLVREVVALVGADAADCWLFDERRRRLRCRAVHGLPPAELGREIEPEGTIRDVIDAKRPLLKRDFARTEDPPPSAAYAGFEEAMDAPIVVLGEVRGVLGTCSRTAGRFDEEDLEVLDAYATLASLALRNAEAFEERSRQARVQRAFYRVASVLAEPLSLPATLDAVAQAAGDAFGGLFAAVVAVHPDALELVGGHGVPEPLRHAVGTGLGDADVLRHAAAERRVLASAELARDERFPPAWRELGEACGFGSLLVAPLELPRGDGALVLVFFAGERQLRSEDVELARHLGGAARAALERSELFEAERTSRSLAQGLTRIGGVLATELDPAAVMDEVVEQAPLLLGADAAAIRVVDGADLVVAAAAGLGAGSSVGARAEATGWLSGEVAETRRAVAVDDAAADPALSAADAFVGAGLHAYLGVPLVGAEGALHGVLSVYAARPRAWRGEEVEALLALAANTSAALSNAELYQRVALEKERSAAILENVADGIVALDRDGNVVLWNRAAEAVTGVPASEALGRAPEQLLGRSLTGASLVPIVRGGGEIWLSVTEAVMRDPAGLVAGRIYAFRDISSDRLVEEMKSEFVATVSHELRGPLTSIYGFAETLLRRDVLFGEEERRVFLGYIARESERLTTIVDALLSVARLDSGDLHVELAPTDVRPLVSELVTSIGGEEVNGHDLVLELPPEPLAAKVDPEKLRQVLAHLLDNAIRYSPDGGRVTIAARRKADTVEFHVADEGTGIPALERDRIFRKFYRADHHRGGTGLGLFIAQGLVNAMGGRIWVESEEGEGSRFAFELPAARV